MTKIPHSRRNLDLAIDRITNNREEALQTKKIMANVIVGQMLLDSVDFSKIFLRYKCHFKWHLKFK